MPDDKSVTGEQLAAAEQYLRALGVPEDRWILDEPLQDLKVSQLTGRLGMGEGGWRGLAESGQVPHAVKPNNQVGWRLPRSGVIFYLATLRGFKLGDQTQRAG